jgi:hypothetical protein
VKRRFSAKGRGVRPVARSPSLVHLEHFLYTFEREAGTRSLPRPFRASPAQRRSGHLPRPSLSRFVRARAPARPRAPASQFAAGSSAPCSEGDQRRGRRVRLAGTDARGATPRRAPPREVFLTLARARSRPTGAFARVELGVRGAFRSPLARPVRVFGFFTLAIFSPRFERQLPFAPRDDARAGSPRGSPRGSRSRAREDRDAGTRGGRVRSRGARRRRRGVDGPFNFRAVAVRTTSGRASADSAQINRSRR